MIRDALALVDFAVTSEIRDNGKMSPTTFSLASICYLEFSNGIAMATAGSFIAYASLLYGCTCVFGASLDG